MLFAKEKHETEGYGKDTNAILVFINCTSTTIILKNIYVQSWNYTEPLIHNYYSYLTDIFKFT